MLNTIHRLAPSSLTYHLPPGLLQFLPRHLLSDLCSGSRMLLPVWCSTSQSSPTPLLLSIHYTGCLLRLVSSSTSRVNLDPGAGLQGLLHINTPHSHFHFTSCFWTKKKCFKGSYNVALYHAFSYLSGRVGLLLNLNALIVQKHLPNECNLMNSPTLTSENWRQVSWICTTSSNEKVYMGFTVILLLHVPTLALQKP